MCKFPGDFFSWGLFSWGLFFLSSLPFIPSPLHPFFRAAVYLRWFVPLFTFGVLLFRGCRAFHLAVFLPPLSASLFFCCADCQSASHARFPRHPIRQLNCRFDSPHTPPVQLSRLFPRAFFLKKITSHLAYLLKKCQYISENSSNFAAYFAKYCYETQHSYLFTSVHLRELQGTEYTGRTSYTHCIVYFM